VTSNGPNKLAANSISLTSVYCEVRRGPFNHPVMFPIMPKPNFKKPVKVKHFAAKTIDIGESIDWESFLMEIFITFFLGIFAYMGYVGKLALLLFPCAIGSVVCFFISMRTLYWAIKDRRESKASENKKT
jgi:hypothetical protein